jgi:hypothetical protein
MGWKPRGVWGNPKLSKMAEKDSTTYPCPFIEFVFGGVTEIKVKGLRTAFAPTLRYGFAFCFLARWHIWPEATRVGAD